MLAAGVSQSRLHSRVSCRVCTQRLEVMCKQCYQLVFDVSLFAAYRMSADGPVKPCTFETSRVALAKFIVQEAHKPEFIGKLISFN